MPTSRLQKVILSTGMLLIAAPSIAASQNSFEDVITPFSESTVRGYVQPLADALVWNLGTGYFYSSGPARRFGVSLEFFGNATAVSDKMRSYTVETPAGFNPGSVQAPTVFGGKAVPVEHATVPSLSFRASDGVLDATYFPAAMPQLRVAGVFNTEAVVRYFDSGLLGSAYPTEDLPPLKLFGLGVRHSISQYFIGLPFDIAVSGSYNSVTLGDYVKLEGTTFGANVGKGLGILSVMAGAESTSGKLNLAYTSTSEVAPGDVNVDLDSAREMRFTAGAMLDLMMVKVFGSANFGSAATYSVGIRFGS